MSLWVDKYRPHALDKLDYHKPLSAKLKKLVQTGDFPHMLFYGPSGAGKKTRIMALLREIYGAQVEKLRIEHRTFVTPSKSKVELSTVGSNVHIELNPSDAGVHDRVVVQEVLKELAQAQQLNTKARHSFKVVVLSEVDQLTKDAQHALRRTMEKYMSTCRLVLVCESASKVISPIRSRCLAVRVAAPSEAEIVDVLRRVCQREGLVKLPDALGERIAVQSQRNLRRALLMLEACKVNAYPFKEDQDVALPDWELYVKETAARIMDQQTPQRLLEVRKRLYDLLAHCIPPATILRTLSAELSSRLDDTLKVELARLAAHYEHRAVCGQKPIFHLEAFCAKFMYTYKAYMSGIAFDFD